MDVQKVCPTCRIEFTSDRGRPTYCSIYCARRAQHGPIQSKPCQHCGKVFEKQSRSSKWFDAAKFCSHKCEGLARTRTTHACAQCGVEFTSKNGRKEATYCSRECYWIGMRTELWPVRDRRIKLEFSKPTRRRLMEAARNACQKCHSTRKLQFDHIIPIHLGGTADISNGQVLCIDCHGSKTASELRLAFRKE